MDDFCCHYLIDTGSMRKILLQNAIVMQVQPYLPKKREPKSGINKTNLIGKERIFDMKL